MPEHRYILYGAAYVISVQSDGVAWRCLECGEEQTESYSDEDALTLAVAAINKHHSSAHNFVLPRHVR